MFFSPGYSLCWSRADGRSNQDSQLYGQLCMDAILAPRLLAELHRTLNRPLYVAYIDIKSGFDSVDRSALWKALQSPGMPSFLLQVIRDLHTWTTARFRTQHGVSEPFNTVSGVRGGCFLSSDLFCYAIDWLMRLCSGSFGVDVGNHIFTDIDYAEDAVLFATSPEN